MTRSAIKFDVYREVPSQNHFFDQVFECPFFATDAFGMIIDPGSRFFFFLEIVPRVIFDQRSGFDTCFDCYLALVTFRQWDTQKLKLN